MPAGRPSLFKPEFVEQAAKLCELGATDAEIASFFKVTVRTLDRWKHSHPEFCLSLKAGKVAADDRVERSLYNRAVGYTVDIVKPITRSLGNNEGSVIEMVKLKEHYPPDTTAAIFWLKNRRKDQWRDKVETGVTDKDGNDVPLGVADLASASAFLLRKGIEEKKD